MISSFCPFQLEGFTNDNRFIYVREMCGKLTIEINDELVFMKFDIDDLDYIGFRSLTSEWFDWPESLE